MPPIARVRRPGGPDSKAQGAWTTAIYEYELELIMTSINIKSIEIELLKT